MEVAQNLVKTTLEEIEKVLSTKTVVGEPMTVEGVTLIPLISVGFGFGAGGGSGRGPSKKSEEIGEGTGGGSGHFYGLYKSHNLNGSGVNLQESLMLLTCTQGGTQTAREGTIRLRVILV